MMSIDPTLMEDTTDEGETANTTEAAPLVLTSTPASRPSMESHTETTPPVQSSTATSSSSTPAATANEKVAEDPTTTAMDTTSSSVAVTPVTVPVMKESPATMETKTVVTPVMSSAIPPPPPPPPPPLAATAAAASPARPAPPVSKSNVPYLSELSKQLRVLQATNQAQAVEINRLERQLKIAADLQGIHVSELRAALEDACMSEAFAEWQSRVASLRAQLEAATVLSSANSSSTTTAAMPAAAASAEAAVAANHRHQVVTLELRIGELEEMDGQKNEEIQRLYQQLKEQTTKASRLESKCLQQQQELELLKKSQQAPCTDIVPLLAAAPEPSSGNPFEASALVETARQAQTELLVQQNQLVLYQQQYESSEQQWKLKHAQLQARTVVQDERIADLEQQLDSLYTAFGLVREEQKDDLEQLVALQDNLQNADEAVAKQVSGRNIELELYEQARNNSQRSLMNETPNYASNSQRSLNETTPNNNSDFLPRSPPRSSRSQSSSSSRQLQLHQKQQRQHQNGTAVHAGELLLRTNNPLRKWKKQRAVLYIVNDDNNSDHNRSLSLHASGGGYYQLELGGKFYALPYGLARLEQDTRHPWSFALHTNLHEHNAPVLYLAATNATNYDAWIAALVSAVVDYASEVSAGEQHQQQAEWTPSAYDAQASASSPPSTPIFNDDVDDNNSAYYSPAVLADHHRHQQEQSDLEHALRISAKDL